MALAVTLSAIPFYATQIAYAGGSHDYNFVTGAKAELTSAMQMGLHIST